MKIERVYEGTKFITGLRAIAVLLVFLIHSGGAGLTEFGGALSTLVTAGKYGVEIFFVISGFTIFYQLFEGNYTLKRFC
jgi:peptidoglycan/LPS O-acetylase OafA/YrhL